MCFCHVGSQSLQRSSVAQRGKGTCEPGSFFRQFSGFSKITLKKFRDALENRNHSHYGVSMTLDSVSVREMVHLVHAYVNYRKHPCLVNHTSLMSCLENFSAHINRLEDLEGADFLSAEI